MSNDGERCVFVSYNFDEIIKQDGGKTGLLLGAGASVLRMHGGRFPIVHDHHRIFDDPAGAMVAAAEFRREDYQRQRPDHPSRYDQIMQWSASEPEPPARRRRKPKPILLKCNTRGIVELHRLYLAMGQTADEFAYYCGITRKQLFEYFDNRRHPSPEVRKRIKSRTGIDVGEPAPRRRPRGPSPRFTDAKRPT